MAKKFWNRVDEFSQYCKRQGHSKIHPHDAKSLLDENAFLNKDFEALYTWWLLADIEKTTKYFYNSRNDKYRYAYSGFNESYIYFDGEEYLVHTKHYFNSLLEYEKDNWFTQVLKIGHKETYEEWLQYLEFKRGGEYNKNHNEELEISRMILKIVKGVENLLEKKLANEEKRFNDTQTTLSDLKDLPREINTESELEDFKKIARETKFTKQNFYTLFPQGWTTRSDNGSIEFKIRAVRFLADIVGHNKWFLGWVIRESNHLMNSFSSVFHSSSSFLINPCIDLAEKGEQPYLKYIENSIFEPNQIDKEDPKRFDMARKESSSLRLTKNKVVINMSAILMVKGTEHESAIIKHVEEKNHWSY